MTYLSRVILFGLLLTVAGCVSSTTPQATGFDATTTDSTVAASAAGAASATAHGAIPVAQTLTAPVNTAPSSGEYRIASQDLVEVTVFRVPDLSKVVQVNSGGDISLPLIGDVPAGGKTVAELERDIAARLKKDYLQNPQVSVFVKEAAGQRVTVEGAVGKPGLYPASGSTTLMQVVAQAGGLQRIADPRGIVVFRYVNGKRQAAKFDFEAVRKGNADDPLILGGDVVVVDQSGIRAAMQDVRESLTLFGLFTPLI